MYVVALVKNLSRSYNLRQHKHRRCDVMMTSSLSSWRHRAWQRWRDGCALISAHWRRFPNSCIISGSGREKGRRGKVVGCCHLLSGCGGGSHSNSVRVFCSTASSFISFLFSPFFHLLLRFWNHTFTCSSDSPETRGLEKAEQSR